MKQSWNQRQFAMKFNWNQLKLALKEQWRYILPVFTQRVGEVLRSPAGHSGAYQTPTDGPNDGPAKQEQQWRSWRRRCRPATVTERHRR